MKTHLFNQSDIMIKLNYCHRGEEKTKMLRIQDIIRQIREGKYLRQVTELRENIALLIAYDCHERVGWTSRLPVIHWAEGDGGYTGLVALTLPAGDYVERMEDVRRLMMGLQQLRCAFRGASGRTLKVVLPYCVIGGGVPEGKAEIEAFHASAHQKAAAFVMQMTGLRAEDKDIAVAQGVRMSVDADAYFNPNAIAIPTEMPRQMPDTLIAEATDLPAYSKAQLPGYTELEMDVTKFNVVCTRVGFDADNPVTESILALATECRRKGVEEEVAVKCTLSLCGDKAKETLIRTSFLNAYAGKHLGAANGLSAALFNQQLLHHYLSSRYLFRRNVITGGLEYNERGKYLLSWRPLTAHTQNTICLNAMKAGIEIWDKDLTRYLQSDYVTDFDPVQEWLYALPEWDGIDRLGQLTASVKNCNPQWDSDFRVWMRSMVSQWMNRGGMYGSSIVLMLIGGQGTGKSTFCKRLMPEELNAYYNDRIDFTNKREAERALMRFCLICMDEFDQITPSQTAYLKHIIQKSDIKWRKMYQDDIEQRRRYAAFCATTNSPTPLTDPTGSRRYLDLTDRIDTAFGIDHRQLYAQIVSEIRSGKPTFFSVADELRIQQMNQSYYREQPLETVVNSYVHMPKDNEQGEWLSAVEITTRIKSHFNGIKVDASTVDKISKMLSNRGVQRKRTHSSRLYYVAVV